MHKVIFACLLAFCSITASLLLAQPLVQTAGPGGGTLFCLEEVGSDLWVGTPNGIYVSSDNAATWIPLPMDSALYVMDLLAFGDTVLMSARGLQAPGPGTGQGVWRSTDRGISWQKTHHIPSTEQINLTFLRSQGVVVLGVEQGWPMISYNSGQTWQNHVPPYDANHGYSFAYSSDSLITLLWNNTYFQYISVSRDGFVTWQKVDSLPMSQAYEGIQYLDSVVCILVKDTTGGAGGSTFRRSRDYARTWDTLSTPLAFGAIMQEYQSDTLFAYEGNTQTVMYSVDRCASWQVSPNQNVVFNHYLGWDNVVAQQQQRFFIPPAYFNYYPYYSFGREVEVTDLLTKQVTHSTQGINATRCYGLTTVGGTLYAGELVNETEIDGIHIFHSEDGANSWQEFSAPNGWDLLPVHIREVPGKPDSLVSWGSIGMSLYRKSLQQTSFTFGSGYIDCPDQVADYHHSVLYRDYSSLYAFNLDTWMEETIPLPLPSPQTNMIYKIASFQDSLVYVLFDEGVISGNPATATWTVTPLPQFTWYPPTEIDFNYRMTSLPTFLQPNDSTMALVGADVPLVITHDGGQTWITKACAGLPFNAASNSPHLPIMSVVWQGQWLGYVPEYGLYLSADEGDSWQFFRKLPFQCTGMKLMGNLVFFSSRNAGVWRLGGSPNLLTGKVFLDQNNNQTQDAGEPALKNMKIASDAAGNVTNSRPDGTYALLALLPGDSAQLRTPLYTMATPAKIALTGQNQAQDWAVQFIQTVPDLAGDATATTVFRPGFTTPVTLTCRNVGAIAQTATVTLQLDPYVSYISASPAPTVSGNTLTWATPLLGYLDDFQANVMLSTPVIVPPTQDSVLLSWTITSAATDAAPANNAGVIHAPVLTSYDPNDKSCNFGNSLPLQAGDSTEALVYTIRFQNMGTYQADKVVVADTLDPALDPATLEVIASSHAMRLEQSTENLQFIFDPIVLPAAQDNEPGSHGFVKYSVRLRPEMPLGTEVENTAFIYFDFNPAIITNTVTTRLTTSLIPSPGILLAAWQVYPNPVSETLFVRPSQPVPAGCVLSVFDLQGNQLRQQSLLTVGVTAVNMSRLAAGWYFCRIADADGRTLATGKVEVR